jgi:hypothetical protein
MVHGFGEDVQVGAQLRVLEAHINKEERRFYVNDVNDEEWSRDWKQGEWIG